MYLRRWNVDRSVTVLLGSEYIKLVEVGTPIASGLRVDKGYCLAIVLKRYYNNI